MAKGEIARFEQFLLCHYVFEKPSATEASESVFMWERIKPLASSEAFYTPIGDNRYFMSYAKGIPALATAK